MGRSESKIRSLKGENRHVQPFPFCSFDGQRWQKLKEGREITNELGPKVGVETMPSEICKKLFGILPGDVTKSEPVVIPH